MASGSTRTLWVSIDGNDVRVAPPRKRLRNRYREVAVSWLRCVEDFAGNSHQPGFWADLWRGGDGGLFLSIGGAWEHYFKPPRHRHRRLHRYKTFRQLPPGWIPDTADDIRRLLVAEWSPPSIELPPVSVLYRPSSIWGRMSFRELELKTKKAAGAVFHIGALFRALTPDETKLLCDSCRTGSNKVELGTLTVTAERSRYGNTVFRVEDSGRLLGRTENIQAWQRLLLHRLKKSEPVKKTPVKKTPVKKTPVRTA